MLYFCATPIGNLGDVTRRVCEALAACDAVAAEDTRQTRKLLTHLGIQKPLISCHEHNEAQRADEILELLAQGKSVCYCSDAGMPLISDPGAVLARACIAAGVPFTVLPGASAVLTALALSGLDTRRFAFEGFLPREKKPRDEVLAQLKAERRTMVLYESPARVGKTAAELAELLGDRPCALCRELTKLHEQVVRTTLLELAQRHGETAPLGECVLVIAGGEAQAVSVEQAYERMMENLAGGMRPKDAARAAALFGSSANELYALYLRRKG